MDGESMIKDSKVFLFFIYSISLFLLYAIYYYYIYPVWNYIGFELDVNTRKILLSIFVLFGFVTITPSNVGVRGFFLNLALTIQLLPSLVLYSLGGKPTASALVVWVALLIVYAVSAIPLPRITVLRLGSKTLMWGLAVATGGLIVALGAVGAGANFNLDFRQVYDFRFEIVDNLPHVFLYLIPIFSKIIIPFGIVLSLYYGRLITSIMFFSSAVLLFGFSSHKGILFYPVLSIGVFYALRHFGKYSIVLVVFILALIVGFLDGIFFTNTDGESIWGWYASLLIRRALMIPALIDYHHIEFFSQNPYLFWSSSRLSLGLIENPYDLRSAAVIGEEYFGSADAGANTGYIGSGFAQAGIVGVAIYAVGVGFVLSILHSYGRYFGLPFIAAIMMGQVMTMLVATDFVTLFLTHGMLISLVLPAFMKSPPVRSARIGRRVRATHPVL